MTVTITITFCVLLLLAYVFDLTSSKTRIPSVILLLLLGWAVRQATTAMSIELPDFTPVLPALGTIGLILIVLEGSLELEFNRSKFTVIRKSFLSALIPMVALAFAIAFLFRYVGDYNWKVSLINAIPFAVISSSIAIPSVRNVVGSGKEFVIYESSFSDIIGVLLFNFMTLNATIDAQSFGNFGLQLLIITAISFVATIALSFLLSKIDHHIKFIPIIILVVLIYFVSKVYHLPGLVFILLFGLFIGNIDELRRFKWLEKFKPDELNKEVARFKEITIEAAFLVRAVFFLLFGYLIETAEVLNLDSLLWSVAIVALIFGLRYIQLKVGRLPLRPLLFVAPRGLINILLFLSIPVTQQISIVNRSVVIQVIVLTALIMMIGLMTSKQKEEIPA